MEKGSEDSTQTGVRVIARALDGTERNVTEGVQVLYDLVIQSMDWGSGFLSVEDVEPLVELARFCGFRDFEEAERYVQEERQAERRRACSHEQARTEPFEPPIGSRSAGWHYAKVICDDCGYQRIDAWPESPPWPSATDGAPCCPG